MHWIYWAYLCDAWLLDNIVRAWMLLIVSIIAKKHFTVDMTQVEMVGSAARDKAWKLFWKGELWEHHSTREIYRTL